MATRCPACATVFRVVPDQLRVSDGWVRCGRCAEVFNAGERLVDMDTGAPQRMPASDVTADMAADTTADVAAERAAEPPPPPLQAASSRDFALQTLPPATAGDAATAAAVAAHRSELVLDIPAQRTGRDDMAAAAADAATGFAATDVPIDPPTAADGADADALADALAGQHDDLRADTDGLPPPTPSFVRRADRAARWRTPAMRAALGGAAVLAGLCLLAQLAYEYRDLIAARFAVTRPVLEQACALAGCTVGAARAIDGLAVDSSGLVRVEKSNVYKLSLALRNRAGIDLAVPTLDLALTDSQGRLLARRALRLAELGVSQATIAAGRDLALQATLQAQFGAGNEVVAGYTIELFYP